MDNRKVTRAIGRVVWPALREVGFDSFTGRSAWRYAGKDVDVVNLQSFGGMLADSVGCTSFSFQVNLGVWRPGDAFGPPRVLDQRGRPRPQEYECEPAPTRTEEVALTTVVQALPSGCEPVAHVVQASPRGAETRVSLGYA